MTTAPEHWSLQRLDAVADVRLGRQRSPKNHSGPNMRPYLRAANVDWDGLKLDDIKQMNFSDNEMTIYRLQSGDIVLGEASGSPAEVGKPALWKGEVADCAFQNTLLRVRSRDPDPRYLLHWLRHLALSGAFAAESRGVGIHHIGRAKLAAWVVPLPPLDEQRRIVEILENHLSRLDAAGASIAASAGRLHRLRQAALATAIEVAGADPRSEVLRISDIARVGSGATPLKSRVAYYHNGTIPWITSGDLWQSVVCRPTQFITETALRETAVKIWPRGTLLVAMYGEGKTRGTCAELAIDATTNQACAAIDLYPEHRALRPWLRLFLDANYWALRRSAAGGVQPNLSLGIIKAIKMPVPPTEQRASLVDRDAAMRVVEERLASGLTACGKRANVLRRALMQAAFSGRLTGSVAGDDVIEELAGV